MWSDRGGVVWRGAEQSGVVWGAYGEVSWHHRTLSSTSYVVTNVLNLSIRFDRPLKYHSNSRIVALESWDLGQGLG